MITGFVSKILDFSKFSTDIGVPAGALKPLERAVTPSKILKCPYAEGIRWVCNEGDTGKYILYNIATEIREMNFADVLSTKLALMDGTKCTRYDDNKVFCANLGVQSATPIILDLLNPTANAIVDYPNDFYRQNFPIKPRGADKSGSWFAIWGGDKNIDFVLFDMSDEAMINPNPYAKIIKKWSNPTANPDFELCNLSVQLGLFFLVNTQAPPAASTQFIDIMTGQPVPTVPAALPVY